MAGILAFCEKCKLVFESKLVGIVGKGSTVQFNNCTVSCPNCGGEAKIPDGIFKNTGHMIEIFANYQNQEDLNKILSILEYAKKNKLSHEEVTEKIKKEAPELSKISDILPKTRTELYAFITLIIMFISQLLLLVSSRGNLSKHELEKQLQITINNYNLSNSSNSIKKTDPNTVKIYNDIKVGRNTPCPCGSGKKYKNCCGK